MKVSIWENDYFVKTHHAL